MSPEGQADVRPAGRAERRLGVTWDYELTDAAGLWPEQLGLDTCGECDVDDPSDEHGRDEGAARRDPPRLLREAVALRRPHGSSGGRAAAETRVAEEGA